MYLAIISRDSIYFDQLNLPAPNTSVTNSPDSVAAKTSSNLLGQTTEENQGSTYCDEENGIYWNKETNKCVAPERTSADDIALYTHAVKNINMPDPFTTIQHAYAQEPTLLKNNQSNSMPQFIVQNQSPSSLLSLDKSVNQGRKAFEVSEYDNYAKI